MPWLALTAAVLASAHVPSTAPGGAVRVCAGGAFVFFARRSAELDATSRARLDSYVQFSREQDLNGRIKIESAGDGYGTSFDAHLSRRRSQAIRAYLTAHGVARRRTRIALQEELGVGDPPARPEDEYYLREGWVAEFVTPESYRRRYPPDMIVECF